jgi:hypothetical protein
MAMDLAALMRLKGAARASLSSIETGQSGVAGHAMVEAYTRCRSEVRVVLGDELRPEFDRLFPEMPSSRRSVGLQTAAQFNEARGHLGRLDGWIEGQIEYLKFERQVQLEAEAKAKKSTEIGFKPIDTRERTSVKDPPPQRRRDR